LDQYLIQDFITLYQGNLETDRVTKLDWPIQSPPTLEKLAKLWVRCLRKCFITGSGNKLRKPLGNWLIAPHLSVSQWPSYYDPLQQILYIRMADIFHTFTMILKYSSSTVFFSKADFTITSSLPITAIPVDVKLLPDTYKVSHNKVKLNVIDESISKNTDLTEAISNAPSWQRDLLKHFRIHDLEHLISSIENPLETIFIVTDGGMSDGKGSFGVSVGTATLELYSAEGPAPGYVELMTSFRSEGYGMLAGLQFLRILLHTYTIIIPNDRKFHLHCDNLALINGIKTLLSNTFTPPRMYIKSESDIILQIIADIRILEALGITLIIEHVKGHQDKTVPYHALSRQAQLNIHADQYATNYLRHGHRTHLIS
jgi:hypothetical protein